MNTIRRLIARVTGLNRGSVSDSYRAAFRRNVRNRYRRVSSGGKGG
jgi:hypothetical protein